jgi:hypothetical protein
MPRAGNAWTALLPSIRPKPQSADVAPEGFLALNIVLTAMRARASAARVGDFAETLALAEKICADTPRHFRLM